MGCDIHIFVEVKKEGKWEVFKDNIFPDGFGKFSNTPFDYRNYYMYSLFAGVRGWANPIIEQIGFPDDSEYLNNNKMFYDSEISWNDSSFYHNRGYYTLQDLIEYEYTEEDKEELSDWYFQDLGILKTVGEPSEVRIIFAFDN